jgi:CubicO group peptidase (beta-lactamase class C family)
MKNLLKLCLLSASVFSSFVTKADNPKTPTDSLNRFIEKKMKEAGIVGLSAAIILDKKLIWSEGYGLADTEKFIPFTPKTIMNIGSISKTFTGACIMKAVEQQKLSLDEDINVYLPFKVVNPNFPDAKITLRHLATHTSSLADRYPFYDSTYYYGGDSPVALGDFLKDYFVPGGKHYSPENFLNAKPGTMRDYSNIAAGLAGYIVELRTGMKLNEYCRKYIFKPLKMSNSGWFLSEVNLARHSRLYDNETGKSKVIPLYSVPTYPDGGVRTSVSELSAFFIALLNEGEYNGKRILEKATVREMVKFQFTETDKPENVDLKEKNSGIFWATKMNVTRIGHGGTDPGVKTEMLADLTGETGVILFCNTTLSKENAGKFYEIYNALWKYAATLKIAGKAKS